MPIVEITAKPKFEAVRSTFRQDRRQRGGEGGRVKKVGRSRSQDGQAECIIRFDFIVTVLRCCQEKRVRDIDRGGDPLLARQVKAIDKRVRDIGRGRGGEGKVDVSRGDGALVEATHLENASQSTALVGHDNDLMEDAFAIKHTLGI